MPTDRPRTVREQLANSRWGVGQSAGHSWAARGHSTHSAGPLAWHGLSDDVDSQWTVRKASVGRPRIVCAKSEGYPWIVDLQFMDNPWLVR